jgi:hypothetical protein
MFHGLYHVASVDSLGRLYFSKSLGLRKFLEGRGQFFAREEEDVSGFPFLHVYTRYRMGSMLLEVKNRVRAPFVHLPFEIWPHRNARVRLVGVPPSYFYMNLD